MEGAGQPVLPRALMSGPVPVRASLTGATGLLADRMGTIGTAIGRGQGSGR